MKSRKIITLLLLLLVFNLCMELEKRLTRKIESLTSGWVSEVEWPASYVENEFFPINTITLR